FRHADHPARGLDRGDHRRICEQQSRHRVSHCLCQLALRYGAGVRSNSEPADLQSHPQRDPVATGGIRGPVAFRGAALAPGVTAAVGHFFRTVETDVLVVGGGLAALRAAISARQVGARVLVAVKRLFGRSGSSALTTGGYAAALPALNAHDDRDLHYPHTVVGGGFIKQTGFVASPGGAAPAPPCRFVWFRPPVSLPP